MNLKEKLDELLERDEKELIKQFIVDISEAINKFKKFGDKTKFKALKEKWLVENKSV